MSTKMTAADFRRQYAKTGDKRTKKKSQVAKVETSSGHLVKCVVIEVGDVTHYVPEYQNEIISKLTNQSNGVH